VVGIAGDQVATFARHIKLPEEWVRDQEATRLSKVLLTVNGILLGAGLFSGLVILFILRLKERRIAWRPAAKVGVFLALVVVLIELNALPLVFRQYPTYLSWNTFVLYISITYLVVPVFFGFVGWIVVALATSFYPDAWRIFRASDRRAWRRDALIAMALSLAAGAGLSRLSALVAARFHAYLPVGIDLIPDTFNTFLPGLAAATGAFRSAILIAAFGGLVIYLVRLGLARRAWWLWLALPMALVALGPTGAHSLREFLAGWAVTFVSVVVLLAVIVFWFRDNVLAYVATAFCIGVARPLVAMLREPEPFIRLNGVALALLALIVLAWLFMGGGSEPATSPPAQPALPPQ
jgi:hypothetical protein